MRQLAKCREHYGCVCFREKIEHLTAELKEARTKLEKFELPSAPKDADETASDEFKPLASHPRRTLARR